MCGVAYEGMGSWMVSSQMTRITHSMPFVRRVIGGHISSPELELELLLVLLYEMIMGGVIHK